MGTNWQPLLEQSGRAKYRALIDCINKGIADGALEPGQKLPPVRELAYRLEITPGTVARAYSLLVEDGVLTAGVGRGTYVADLRAKVANVDTGGMIDFFSPRIPNMGQEDLIRDALRKVASSLPANALMQYPKRETNLAARKAFVAWMKDAPIGHYTLDDIVITHGGQNAILHVMQAVLRGNDPVVLVDEVTFSGFRRGAELCRARVVGVPWDGEGPDPQALDKLVQSTGAALYCTSAETNNPTTRSTSARRRREIADVASRHGLHILDDDCYNTGRHSAESYRALLPDHGWYISSPSKLVSPSLRIGFTVPPNGWVGEMLRSAQFSHFGVSSMLTEAFAHVMSNPKLPGIIKKVQAKINEDLRFVVNQLGGYPIRWRSDVPLVWVELPSGWRAPAFAQAAEARGVEMKSADEFTLREGRAVHAVRVALNGQMEQGRFEEGIKIIRALLDNPPRSFST
ncbi:aminotransferase-like domain-containing protein [Cognatishimia activa]|uniref:HTH-type transcriptional regulator NorG n=1 Tax=Cognatishimia activa TaxID=1715691 RepID=A0A0P1IPD0_9RHOB|nr:PLP-dependent aminotransferase family protein [Cognatishimia activa]MEE2944910.1 PLP-dependent aminotransferase family protein [Pseudomonadota bacterium]CUJ24109.1 HTH-type transcriptional regulator NorG [Cognatishimia activa]CUK25371.1 HTH-type transcriptional regulator NorG [Cognatishimia activa]